MAFNLRGDLFMYVRKRLSVTKRIDGQMCLLVSHQSLRRTELELNEPITLANVFETGGFQPLHHLARHIGFGVSLIA
jgi:hypothetical protein